MNLNSIISFLFFWFAIAPKHASI